MYSIYSTMYSIYSTQEADLINLDPDSRQAVLDLLEGDGQTDSTDTKRALRNTSRQVCLTAEEKLVFQSGLVSLVSHVIYHVIYTVSCNIYCIV